MNMFMQLFGHRTNNVIKICDFIREDSPRAKAPPQCEVDLWDHQQAMIQRCINIEKHYQKVTIFPTNAVRYITATKPKIRECGIGIMSDPPGSGKTYVALSIVMLDHKNITIAIVPPNLHSQWAHAIKVIGFQNTEWVSVNSYSQAMDIPHILTGNTKLILTTSILAETVGIQVKELSKNSAYRVIVDEIDTSSSNFEDIPECKFVWFMSASFNPQLNRQIGPFDLSKLTEEAITNVVCRTDAKFIQQSQCIVIEEPITKVLEVPDGDLALFNNVLDQEDIILLNAMNIKKVKSKVLTRKEIKVDSLQQLANEMLIDISDTAKCEQLLINMECIKENPDNLDTKLLKIREIIQSIAKDNTCKWIFFSDDDDIFDIVVPELMRYNVQFSTLTEGTLEKVCASMQKYRESKEVKVILINSMKHGCGLNLENTTDILFLHYTAPQLVEQVIGRAQRPGRTSRLHITCIYHTNEMQSANDNTQSLSLECDKTNAL